MASTGSSIRPIPDKGLGKRMDRIEAPMLLVRGEDDRLVPFAYAEEFVDHSPRASRPRRERAMRRNSNSRESAAGLVRRS